MKKAVLLGKFNNPHMGHLDLVRAALDVAPNVVIVFSNGQKNADFILRTHMMDRLIKYYLTIPEWKIINYVYGGWKEAKLEEADYVILGKDRLPTSGIGKLAPVCLYVHPDEDEMSSTKLRAKLESNVIVDDNNLFDGLQCSLQLESKKQYDERNSA